MLKTGKVEFGQGILLALRQIAAEEWDLTVDAVVTVSGDTSASPFEGGTVGSMKDNTQSEAGTVYGAMDMPWAKLVGQIAHAYGK